MTIPRHGSLLVLVLAAAACSTPGDPGPLSRSELEDVTEVVGLDYRHFNGMSGQRYLVEMMGPGAAVADFDGDGDLDLFLTQGRLLGEDAKLADALLPPPVGSPSGNRYYRSDRIAEGAGFRLVDASRGLDLDDYGMGLAVGDYDRDGDVDLYLTAFGPDRLLRNRGDGSWEEVTGSAGLGDARLGQAAVFWDYDRDGWLDLYVQNYVDFSLETHKPCFAPNSAIDYCGPLSFNPEPDRLFRNRGDGTYEDVSAASGLARAYGAGLGAVARDVDGDGWLDLYVSNDGAANLLWLNRRDGTLIENAELAGCAVNAMGVPEGSMGIAAADFDADRDVDLFVTHLAEETNTFYSNDGGGHFTDATARAGLAVPSRGFTGFGAAPIDLDNDGLLDLVAVNGAVRVIAEQDAAGDRLALRQRNQAFRNLGDGAFADVSGDHPALSGPLEVSRAVAVGDLDGDGTTDLVVTNNSGPAQVLRNRSAGGSHWLGVALRDRAAGEGSRVLVASGDGVHLRYASTDGSYLAASDPRVVVGLGGQEEVDAVDVEWTAGRRQRFARPPVDRYLVVGPAGGAA